MNAAARLSSTLLIAAAFTLACGADPAPAPTRVSGPQIEEREPGTGAPQTGTPRIAADEPVHDFGAIKATGAAEHVFKIRNAGDADLKIERVQRT